MTPSYDTYRVIPTVFYYRMIPPAAYDTTMWHHMWHQTVVSYDGIIRCQRYHMVAECGRYHTVVSYGGIMRWYHMVVSYGRYHKLRAPVGPKGPWGGLNFCRPPNCQLEAYGRVGRKRKRAKKEIFLNSV